ncbi:Variant-specific surface protein, partial [Giardia duodenalis]
VNDPAGIPIDGFCWPSTSPQATAAGCTGKDGAALTNASTACGMCSGEFFLFRGGCYKAGQEPGSEICTTAEGGRCTTCKTDTNYIFQNPAASPTLGSECILCSDATDRDGYKGVANCNTCTAPGSALGTAACNTCKAGFSGASCTTPCGGSCASCDKSNGNTCTSCSGSKYLLGTSCVDSSGCGNGKYADPQSNKCLECGLVDCDTCTYDAALQGPKCLTCTSSKIVKEETNGATTCSEVAACTQYNANGPNFLTNGNARCALCSNVTDSTTGNQGIAHCITCQKASDSTAPTCSACGNGHFLEGNACTATCGTGCATCSESTNPNKCLTCMAGFFLVTTGENKKCVACDSTPDGGREGCSACSNNPTFKCADCRANYRKQPNGGASDDYTCTKTCEDDSACGGTAGSCDAIVVGGDGSMKYYCSHCGESTKFPIDGICNSDKGSNQCSKGVCTQCADGYFLYMGGCYKVNTAPGSFMCSKASTTPGVCETPNANSRYFAVPGAKATDQSVLGCGNPLGVVLSDTNAYVGVEGCKTCEAPTAATGMAAAKCTACDGGKALTGSGYGCVTCGVAGCSTCKADNICEVCSDGHRLEGEACVSTGGPNLSTGAIAGISVAAVVVVGGPWASCVSGSLVEGKQN